MDTVSTALPMLILFSVGVQMSEGSSFGIVPYINPAATGTIAGIIGAGGNCGAVAWGLMFRFTDRPPQDTLMYVGVIVLIAAATCPITWIKDQPGMFGINPRNSGGVGDKEAKLHLASDEQLQA